MFLALSVLETLTKFVKIHSFWPDNVMTWNRSPHYRVLCWGNPPKDDYSNKHHCLKQGLGTEHATSHYLNSLWSSDAIWRHRSGTTLVHVMACCLTAPSHYMNQCWRIIRKVLWHLRESNFIGSASDVNPWKSSKSHFRNYFHTSQGPAS